jgi:hypothetical protein
MKAITTPHQADFCWTSNCAILLLHIQNAAYLICPAFYYERRISHNERLLSILSETVNEKVVSLASIKKELFIYSFFAKQNPQTVTDWNKTASEGEKAFTSADLVSIKLIIEPLIKFIAYPQTTEYIFIHNTLITNKEFQLFELFKHIAIQVNYLKD